MLLRMLGRALKPTIKGIVGETIASAGAMLTLPAANYTRFADVTLPVPDGTTQVDFVIVSQFAVFVVEVKNMSGWIFGGEANGQWTQRFRNGEKFRFQNPLLQNYRHTKAVESALRKASVPAKAIQSVVVFVGDATLKTPVPENVTVGFEAITYIKSFDEVILSENQVEAAGNAIKNARLSDTAATHRAHVDGLRSRSDETAPRKCPKCGSPMGLRTARQGPNAGGEFWGCKGFPKCKTTMKASRA